MTKRIAFIILALIALLSSFSVSAQQRKGSLTGPDGELEYSDGTKVREQYFVDNVLLLDPIEGIWKFEVITRGWNNYRRFPDSKIAEGYYVVIKQGSKYVVYQGDDSFQKIGENTYRIQHYVVGPNGKQMTSNTFRLTDYSAFSVTVDLAMAADYVGSQGQHIITYSKVRPTKDDYYKAYEAAMAEAEVARKKAEEPTEWSGTGFALNNGYIVTNYHVVDGAKSIMVYGVNGQMNSGLKADVVAKDKTNDLAIIKITDYNFNGFGTIPYAVKNRTLDVGEDVWVLGYPLTPYLGNEIKLTNGLVSSKSGYQGDVATYQISAPVQPGNSGGPLFDSKGNVIGIVNAGVPGAENVGYAIKTSYLFNLADSYSITSSLPSSNLISSLLLTDQVKRVRGYVFLLMCSANANATSSRTGSSISSGSSHDSSLGSSSSNGHMGSTSSTTGSSNSSYLGDNNSQKDDLGFAQAPKTGDKAPDFTAQKVDGNMLKLSSLLGKYVVLDFWGSWCKWCIKGFPDMKTAYAKHKGKVEFVGIACRDTEEKWKAATAKYELPWISVLNPAANDLVKVYDVKGFPTKIVIDPKGNIVKIVLGEDPAFYTYLDSILK